MRGGDWIFESDTFVSTDCRAIIQERRLRSSSDEAVLMKNRNFIAPFVDSYIAGVICKSTL